MKMRISCALDRKVAFYSNGNSQHTQHTSLGPRKPALYARQSGTLLRQCVGKSARICGITKKTARRSIDLWAQSKARMAWKHTPGQRNAKKLINKSSNKLTSDLQICLLGCAAV
jgi:hypothetical protein